MNGRDANPFWCFSLDVYERRGVAEACLSLQDREGLDVNILLFCCWAGYRGQVLSRAQIRHLAVNTENWQANVVKRLRASRTWMKHAPVESPFMSSADVEALRQRVKDVELAAERLQQEMLHELMPIGAGETSIDALVTNFHNYFAVLERTPGPEDTADLVAIVLAAVPRYLAPLDVLRRFEGDN